MKRRRMVILMKREEHGNIYLHKILHLRYVTVKLDGAEIARANAGAEAVTFNFTNDAELIITEYDEDVLVIHAILFDCEKIPGTINSSIQSIF